MTRDACSRRGHRAQRLVEPGLSPAYEDPAVARAEIDALAAKDGRVGVGRPARRRRRRLPPRHAAAHPRGARTCGSKAPATPSRREPEIVRDLYGVRRRALGRGGRDEPLRGRPGDRPGARRRLVPGGLRRCSTSTRSARRRARTRRSPCRPASRSGARSGATSRRSAASTWLSRNTRLRSPVFSPLPPPSLEEATNEWEEGFDDPALRDVRRRARRARRRLGGRLRDRGVVGAHGIVRPPNAGFLGFAAVLPEARGLGAGRALGEAVLVWARDAGHPTVVTDWRETNLLSSRTWPRLGFRPTFRRLFRAIA